jgi:integrase
VPKISQALLSRLKPAAHDIFVWDSAMPGFGFRLKPSGSGSFIIQYRNAGGRSRRYRIGRYGRMLDDEARKNGMMTATEARKEARRLLSAIDRGADPASGRMDKRGAPTMADLATRYFKEHAEPHKAGSSVASDKRLNKAHIEARLGRHKVADVTRADVAKMHHALRDTPYEANRALALLSKMMHLAEAWGLRPDGSNPCRHVKRYAEAKRERFLSAAELERIGKALAEAERNGSEAAGVIATVRLLALTGCRVGEILGLRWKHVDLTAGVLRLPESKTGAKTVPLGAPARVLLAEIAKGGDDAGRYVVHGGDAKKPLSVSGLEKAWARLRKKAATSDARLHDFRHTVGTYGGAAGFNAFIIRDLLGHKTLAMTGRYVEKDADPLKVAADAVAGRIAAAMEGKKAEIAPATKTKESA